MTVYQLEILPLSTITIRTVQLENIEVATAWQNSSFAVHHFVIAIEDADGEIIHCLSISKWTLTHIPSGIAVWHHNDKELLISKAQSPALLKLMGFVKYDEDGRSLLSPFLKRKLREVILLDEGATLGSKV